jgi:hypothetical protein
MAPFYCRACTDLLGYRPTVPTTDVLGSRYQRDKHAKHTSVSSEHTVQTVFDSSSTRYYDDCVREAYQMGAVELSDRGTNLLFCPSTGSTFGTKYKWGIYGQRQDTFFVVKTTDPTKMHAMLKGSSDFSNQRCGNCGQAIL